MTGVPVAHLFEDSSFFFMNLKRTPLISLQKRIFPWQKSAFEIKCDIIFDVEFISDVYFLYTLFIDVVTS